MTRCCQRTVLALLCEYMDDRGDGCCELFCRPKPATVGSMLLEACRGPERGVLGCLEEATVD